MSYMPRRISPRRAVSRSRGGHVIVLGMGRFGQAFAREALRLGYEVVAVDEDSVVVDELSTSLPHCVRADSTSERALADLSVDTAELVLVATGSDVEASILTVATLAQLGAPKIWAKARSTRHKNILLKVGAHRVSQPETSEGERLAHQLREGTFEYVPLDDSFSLVEVAAPPSLTGRSLHELDLRSRWGVSVVAIKHESGGFSHADAATIIDPGDVLVVAGSHEDTDKFLRDA